MTTLLISADHGGFELKEQIEAHYDIEDNKLASQVSVVDLGPDTVISDDDYPEYAFKLCEELLSRLTSDEKTLGVLVCRSGNGMAIAANKVKGIRAALCVSPEHAVKAREHNHANVVVLDADYTDHTNSLQIVDAFVTTSELGERHARRVAQIADYESAHWR